jgi:hypothetical protein
MKPEQEEKDDMELEERKYQSSDKRSAIFHEKCTCPFLDISRTTSAPRFNMPADPIN